MKKLLLSGGLIVGVGLGCYGMGGIALIVIDSSFVNSGMIVFNRG